MKLHSGLGSTAGPRRGARRRWGRRGRSLTVGLATLCAALAGVGGQVAGPASADDSGARGHFRPAFAQVNLVSDIPGLAQLHDPEVKNPWGIAFGPDTPLWVANQFNPASNCGENCVPAPEDLLTKVTVYRGANGKEPFSKVDLEVTASSPLGMVFNPTQAFKITQDGVRTPARFLFNELFVGEGDLPEGRITGWSNVPAPAAATTSTDAREIPEVPTGLALVPGSQHRGPRLLVADFLNGVVDVYDARFQKIDNPRLFADPRAVEDGLTPYNVMFLGGKVYVAYAAFGAPVGSVTVFHRDGSLHKRLIVNSPKLLGPWGMAIAPPGWNHLGGSLLVGNVDDGRINAFSRRTGKWRGTLRDKDGQPLVNLGLWGIAFGNGVIGTPRTLVFAAGIGEEVDGFGEEIYTHGLVGLIKPAGARR